MCAKGFISTVPDMLQPSLLNGVDLLVESTGSEGMGAGKKRRGSQEHTSFLLYDPRGVSGPLAGQAEPIPPNLLQACSFFFSGCNLLLTAVCILPLEHSHWALKGQGLSLVTCLSL